MRYMLMFHEPDAVFARRDQPEEAPAYWGAWRAYVDEIMAAGIVQGGNGLHPPATATTLRLADGRRLVQDGPVAATKEQLGGYFVIDVPDLDAALAWAEKSPAAAAGAVEIRPVLADPER